MQGRGWNHKIRELSILTDLWEDLDGWDNRERIRAWPYELEKHVLPQECGPEPLDVRSFTYGGWPLVTRATTLASWSRHCDLRKIQVLRLRDPVAVDALDALEGGGFPSLMTLELGVEKHPTETDLAVARFLRGIPPLRELRLTTEIAVETFTAILTHHGARLRHLELDFIPETPESLIFTADRVTALHQSCPVLTSLILPIPRTRGNQAELSIYQALGSMQKLQDLVLNLCIDDLSLDFSAPDDHTETPNDPSFEKLEQECYPMGMGLANQHRRPRHGHVRNVLMNGALDEELARQIAQTIEKGRCGPRSLKMDHLVLHVRGGRFSQDVEEVMGITGRSWKVKRMAGGSGDRRIVAERIRDKVEVEADQGSAHLPWTIEPVIRSLWPASGDLENDWRKDWHSFPLCEVREIAEVLQPGLD